jgi:hypothetical protein
VLEFSNTGKHLAVSYEIPTDWYIPHDILWVLPRYRATQNTRDVRIAVNEWLWPLQRVIVPITKVGIQKSCQSPPKGGSNIVLQFGLVIINLGMGRQAITLMF